MTFKAGKSGNPSGRPKIVKELQELARTYTSEAFDTIVSIMRTGEREQARVLAADKVLDRGWYLPSLPAKSGSLRL